MKTSDRATRRNISRPESHWAAYQAEAERRGMNLSEFIGYCVEKNLLKAVRDKLKK